MVVPAYNAAETLAACVRSALTQTEPDLEVVVIDDASTDTTFEVATHLGAQDGRVRLLRQDKNTGVSACRNRGLEAATGRWVALLDADDAWRPERIERLLAACHRADAVSDDVVPVHLPAPSPPALPSRRVFAGPQRSVLAWANYSIGSPRELTAVDFVHYDLGLLKPMIRRAFLVENQLRYDPNLRVAEDFYFYLSLLSAGARWIQLADAYYLYTVRAGSLTRQGDGAIALQHVASSAILLAKSVGTSDRALRSALRRHNRLWRGAIAQQAVIELVQQRTILGLARWLRSHPKEAALVAHKALRHVHRRVRRRTAGAGPATRGPRRLKHEQRP